MEDLTMAQSWRTIYFHQGSHYLGPSNPKQQVDITGRYSKVDETHNIHFTVARGSWGKCNP